MSTLETKIQRIEASYRALVKCEKAYLVGEYCRHNRVSDESEVKRMSKDQLATDILVCEYGREAVESAFA